MAAIPTREHHLVSPGAVAAREDYASAITGPRTRWWIFDPAFTNSPAWTQNVGVLPRNLWLLMWFRILPGSGLCGRLQDGHSEVSDTDIQDGNAGGGVSAFAIDHNQGSDSFGSWSGIEYTAEPQSAGGHQYHWTIIPSSSLVFGTWYRLKINLTLGERATGGAIRIWALDFDAVNPVVNLSGINTVWPNQSVMHFFQGPYNIGSSGAAVQMASTRFGLTEADAYADGASRPITWTGDVAGFGPNDYTVAITNRDTVDFGVSDPGTGGTDPGSPPPSAGSTDPVVPQFSVFFGNPSTGVGGSASLTLDARRGSAYQAGSDMTATTASGLFTGITTSADTQTLRAVIYGMSGDPSTGGLPTVKLAESATVSVLGNLSRQWVQFPLVANLNVTKGQWLALEFQAGGTSCVSLEIAQSGGWFFFKSGDTFSDGADSDHGTSTSTDNRNMSGFIGGIGRGSSTRTGSRVAGTRVGGASRVPGAGGGFI